MPYAVGDDVIVRNRGATWPGRVVEVLDGPPAPRYRVSLDGFYSGPADVGADMLEPRPATAAEGETHEDRTGL